MSSIEQGDTKGRRMIRFVVRGALLVAGMFLVIFTAAQKAPHGSSIASNVGLGVAHADAPTCGDSASSAAASGDSGSGDSGDSGGGDSGCGG